MRPNDDLDDDDTEHVSDYRAEDFAVSTGTGALLPEAALVERVSLTGVPEGVGPPISPQCPICTGGRGVPCAWHGTVNSP